jgi:hypothetical protein
MKVSYRIAKSIIQNDSLNTSVEIPLQNKILYRSESQKKKTNMIKIYNIITNGILLNPYIAELNDVI